MIPSITMHRILRAFRGPVTASAAEPVLRFVPAVLYMLLVFAVSSIPGEKITFQFDDRVAHFLEYFVLGGLLVFASAGLRGGTAPAATAAILAFAALHAVADEYHQSLVPGRDASPKDFAFDLLGASVAVFLVRRLTRVEMAR
jgi:hypothetical protein